MQRYAAQTLSRAHATAVGLRKERPVAGSAPARHRAARRTRPLAAAASERPASKTKPPPPITLTETALEHLKKLRQESGGGEDLVLRMGVKSGGCSGMSCEQGWAPLSADSFSCPPAGHLLFVAGGAEGPCDSNTLCLVSCFLLTACVRCASFWCRCDGL